MTTLQERIAKAREHVKLYGERPPSLWAYQDFAINVGELFDAIEEQTRTIGALNQCLGGKGSTSLENITRIGELEAQVAALTKDAARIDALSTPGWELSINSDCECADEELWVVHLCSGGRNDREWRLISSGADPRAAIDAAIAAQKGTP